MTDQPQQDISYYVDRKRLFLMLFPATGMTALGWWMYNNVPARLNAFSVMKWQAAGLLCGGFFGICALWFFIGLFRRTLVFSTDDRGLIWGNDGRFIAWKEIGEIKILRQAVPIGRTGRQRIYEYIGVQPVNCGAYVASLSTKPQRKAQANQRSMRIPIVINAKLASVDPAEMVVWLNRSLSYYR